MFRFSNLYPQFFTIKLWSCFGNIPCLIQRPYFFVAKYLTYPIDLMTNWLDINSSKGWDIWYLFLDKSLTQSLQQICVLSVFCTLRLWGICFSQPSAPYIFSNCLSTGWFDILLSTSIEVFLISLFPGIYLFMHSISTSDYFPVLKTLMTWKAICCSPGSSRARFCITCCILLYPFLDPPVGRDAFTVLNSSPFHFTFIIQTWKHFIITEVRCIL